MPGGEGLVQRALYEKARTYRRVDPRTGVVWVATGGADAVLRFFPETEHFVVHPLPTRSALIRHMELDPKREAAWVAYGNSPAVAPKIARIEIQSH